MKKLIKLLPPLVLVGLSLGLFLRNVVPGTWLIGWDNVLVELNFPLSIKRAFSAVWQEYQGLGLLGGHAHAADLPRIVLLFLLSAVMPQNLLRYSYMGITLVLGPLGAYFLTRNAFLEKKEPRTREVASFSGGLFYLLNLATLQNFYAPQACFTAFYAGLPWLILLVIRYLEEGKRKWLLWLSLAYLIFSPAAFIPTLFLSYLSLLALIVIFYFLKARKDRKARKETLKRTLFIGLITLVINAYWLLPFLHFVTNNAKDVPRSKIYEISSPLSFAYNKEYGRIADVAILKGFWFRNTDEATKTYLLKEWQDHLAHLPIVSIGYLAFAVILFGAIFGLLKKERFAPLALAFFLLSLFILLNENPPLGFLFKLLRDHLPLFKDVLRFPYTKFSAVAALSYTILLSFGIFFLTELLARKMRGIIKYAPAAILGLGLLVYFLPAFQGFFFYPRLRIPLPKEYSQLFEFFKHQDPATRIANLPQPSFWGWESYSWGYTGSGFLWYGIEQPILDRAFDVWSLRDEAYYWEMSQALYSQDGPLLERLLDKYQINWIVLDKNIISPSSSKSLFLEEIETILSKSEKVSLVQAFGNILVYKTDLSYDTNNWLYSPANPQVASPPFERGYRDQAFAELDTYYQGETNVYPFRSFLPEAVPNLSYQEKDRTYVIKTELPPRQTPASLTLPDYSQEEKLLPVTITAKREAGSLALRLFYKIPTLTVNDTQYPTSLPFSDVVFPLPQNGAYLSVNLTETLVIPENLNETYREIGDVYLETQATNHLALFDDSPSVEENFTTALISANPERCGEVSSNDYYVLKENLKEGVTLAAKDASVCLFSKLPSTLTQSWGLLGVSFEYKSREDETPSFCLLDPKTEACLNNKSLKGVGFSQDWKAIQSFVDPRATPEKELWFHLILDAYGLGQEKSLSYRNISIASYPVIAAKNLGPGEIASTLGALRVTKKLPSGTKIPLTISLPEINAGLTYQISPSGKTTAIKAKNCDAFNGQDFTKKLIEEPEQTAFIEYSALNASSCDSFGFPDLPYQTGYLLHLKTENLEGKPLEICLSDYRSEKCQIDRLLYNKTDHGWSDQLLVVPPLGEGTGFSLGLYNLSIGKDRTTNRLASVRVRPFPFNWIQGIKVVSGTSPKTLGQAEIFNPKKVGTWFYRADIDTLDDSLIVLNQAFDSGWVAFATGGKVVSHKLVNNWANGWLIGPGKYRLTIVYLPQYLEFIGFGLLLTLPLYILISAFLKSKKRP